MSNNEKEKPNNNEFHFTNINNASFALQMYMNRFMWISTREIVTGISSMYYNDTKIKSKDT